MRCLWLRTLGGYCALFLLFWGSSAQATQVIAYSEQEMVSRSSMILWGKVKAQKVHKIGPQQRIVTDHLIQIRRLFKGKILLSSLTIRCLGGKMGKIEAYVPGAGQLRVGEEALFYLEAARPLPWEPHPTHYYLTGMAYGLWKLKWSPSHQQYQTIRQADLPTRLAQDAQGRWRPLPHSHEKPRLLSEMLRSIKHYTSKALSLKQRSFRKRQAPSRFTQELQKHLHPAIVVPSRPSRSPKVSPTMRRVR